MNAKLFSMSRPLRYVLGGGAVACAFGVAGALASCNDPTTGKTFAATNLPSTVVAGGETCPGGTAPQQGPMPDAGYCNNPGGFLEAYNEECMPGDWIPGPGQPPPPVRMFTPVPHPDTECPFYRGAYQNWMIAMNPLGSSAGPTQSPSDPALVDYPTLDDAFQPTIPHLTRNTGTPYAYGKAGHDAVKNGPPTGRSWLGLVRQAGLRNVLIDQDHHTLYYGIHMNQAFYDFIQQNGLNTVNGILNVNPNLPLPPGLVEFKTAWKDIDPQDFPDANGNLGTPNGIVPPPPEGDFAISGGNPKFMIPAGGGVSGLPMGTSPTWDANYITTMAWLPYITQDGNGVLEEDRDHPVLRKVALVAMHSVYTLPGHPEFVWGSIQHVDLNAYDPGPIAFGSPAGVFIQGAPDSQPDTTGPGGLPALPALNDPQNATVTAAPSMNDYLLYKGGTPENVADQAIETSQLMLDENSQSFPGQQESVYRMFTGSKSDTLEPDTAVFSLNSQLNYLYGNAINMGNVNPAIDKRFNYRLVSATWMDKPYFFSLSYPGTDDPPNGETFQNDVTNPMVRGVCGAQPQNATSVVCNPPNPPNYYPQVSQGDFCGTPLDDTDTSGSSPLANGTDNTVPGCSTRVLDVANGDNPAELFTSLFSSGFGAEGSPGVPPLFAQDTDYEFSLLAGEDRLSSTAMETFTQNGSFNNCFQCHNTQPINTNGTPYDPSAGLQPLLTKAALINVSHVFSEFVLRDSEEVCGTDAGSPASIPCPGGAQTGDGGTAGH